MPTNYMYVYSPSDFVSGLPAEATGGSAAGPITLTLVADATPTRIEVTENDLIFDELDTGQTLTTAVTIDGNNYAAGAAIVSAYDALNTTSGHKITSFHIGKVGTATGAVQGIVSTVALVAGQTYTFNSTRTSNTENNPYSGYVACFASGSLIETDCGPERIEDLTPGRLIRTLDNGFQPLIWHGQRTVAAIGNFAPVRIKSGRLGLTQDLLVSPQHRMLLTGAKVELLIGQDEAFVSALQLCAGDFAHQQPGGSVTYHHLLFDRHQVIFANGAASESLLPCDLALGGMGHEARAEVLALFPKLKTLAGVQAARVCLRSHEALLLAA